ncbi:MAG: signal peptidase I [Actinomycetota bacterium]|nr:signal peptidase I [Actinomycetota bacterium]
MSELEPTQETPEPSPAAVVSGDSHHRHQSVWRWLLETVLLVALAFLLAQGIKTFIVQPFVIPTGSMIPTIEEKDRILAEKVTFRLTDPKVGDIVVFDDPTGAHPQLIKRVVATAGQTIDIRDGAVYVNGKRLNEPYTHGRRTDPGTVPMPVTVPDGQVWLMGDNRPNSGDSRFLGPQPLSGVHGHAFFTYWPPNRVGALP